MIDETENLNCYEKEILKEYFKKKVQLYSALFIFSLLYYVNFKTKA